MFRRLAIAAVAAAPLAVPAGAGAQTRTVVVPEGAAIVVPPRGSALPRPALKPVAQRPRLPPMAPAREEAGLHLGGAGAVVGVLLPAIAAAAATAVLSNGFGGSGGQSASGPARTR